jgi:hypothetical protein
VDELLDLVWDLAGAPEALDAVALLDLIAAYGAPWGGPAVG